MFSAGPRLIASHGRNVAGDKEILPPGDGGGTSDGMDRVWAKLEEHDRRLDRIEQGISHLPTQQNLVWGAIVFFIALAGLLYGLGSFMSGTMSTALGAIQTVLAAKPSEPQQPTVIVIPQQHVRPIQPK